MDIRRIPRIHGNPRRRAAHRNDGKRDRRTVHPRGRIRGPRRHSAAPQHTAPRDAERARQKISLPRLRAGLGVERAGFIHVCLLPRRNRQKRLRRRNRAVPPHGAGAVPRSDTGRAQRHTLHARARRRIPRQPRRNIHRRRLIRRTHGGILRARRRGRRHGREPIPRRLRRSARRA